MYLYAKLPVNLASNYGKVKMEYNGVNSVYVLKGLRVVVEHIKVLEGLNASDTFLA